MKPLITATIVLLALAMTTTAQAKTVLAADLTPSAWANFKANPTDTYVVEFRKGDVLPVNVTAKGDLIETSQTGNTTITVKRNFWLVLANNNLQMSQDLTDYRCSDAQSTGRTGDWWRQLFLESDLFHSINSMRVPYLALIGDQDSVVSVNAFKSFSDTLKKNRIAFQSEVIPGLGHGDIVTSSQTLQSMLKFISKNL